MRQEKDGMKAIRNFVVAGCSVFLLCQCATQDDVRELNYKIRAVNQKVEEVKTNAVGKMQKRQASSVSKIDQVEGESLRLKSMIEENAHQSSQFRKQTKDDLSTLQMTLEQMRTDQERKLLELEQKVGQLSANLDNIQKARIRAAEERASSAARRAEEARKRTVIAAASGSSFIRVKPDKRKVKVGSGTVVKAAPESEQSVAVRPVKQASSPAAKQPTVETVTVPDTASGPFNKGMSQYNSKKYKDAYRSFEQVLSTNPKGAKAAETLFYMGECLFNQGEYDLAILDYQKVISNHAKDSHTPTALLKQGMSFEKLTDHETAKIIYKKLINDYSGSSEASKAKQRLESL